MPARRLLRLEKYGTLPATYALPLIVLWPAMSSGWFGDDAFLSNIPFAIDSGRFGLLEAVARSNAGWLSSVGRITPLHTLETYFAFDLLRDRLAYKAFIILTTIVAIGSLSVLVQRVAGRRTAVFTTLAIASMLQVRGYHDPYLAYSGSTQIVGILLCWSLYASYEASTRARNGYLIFACVLHVCSCLMYEVSYLFAPIYTAFLCTRLDWRAAMKATAPIFVIDIGFILIALIMRSHVTITPDNPYASGYHLFPMLRALTSQLTSTFPLSYAIFDPSKIYSPPWFLFGLHVDFVDAILIAICAIVIARTVGAPESPRQPPRQLIMAGLLLAVLPALPLVFVVKYQNELRPGLGYLPVFLQAMGLAIILGSWCAGFRTKASTAITAFAILTTVTAASNRHVVAILEPSYRTSRDDFENAVKTGLLASVSPNQSIAFTQYFPWVCETGSCIEGIGTSDLIWGLTHKRIRVVDPASGVDALSYDEKNQHWSVMSKPQK